MGIVLTSTLVFTLVLISGVCSGLNVSLMALELSSLRRKAEAGDPMAIKVLPLRRNTHLVLAAILLFNVGVISATSIVLGDRFNGLIAGAVSTILIVIFGEVLPQAMFVKNALRTMYNFSPILRVMVIITYPLAKPLQLLLDKLFGKEKFRLHSRNELGIILTEHANRKGSELDIDEVTIMQGALQLSNKHVGDIMTPIKTVYWLTLDTVIDADKIDEIKEKQWSRMPVFDSKLTVCHGTLLMKSLVDEDFDDEPRKVKDMTLRKTKVVGSRTALDTLFRRFIAARSHLMPVEKDDKIVGIVTIEDLIEEILGHEIDDEKD